MLFFFVSSRMSELRTLAPVDCEVVIYSCPEYVCQLFFE